MKVLNGKMCDLDLNSLGWEKKKGRKSFGGKMCDLDLK